MCLLLHSSVVRYWARSWLAGAETQPAKGNGRCGRCDGSRGGIFVATDRERAFTLAVHPRVGLSCNPSSLDLGIRTDFAFLRQFFGCITFSLRWVADQAARNLRCAMVVQCTREPTLGTWDNAKHLSRRGCCKLQGLALPVYTSVGAAGDRTMLSDGQMQRLQPPRLAFPIFESIRIPDNSP